MIYLSIVVPVYNESEAIQDTIIRIQKSTNSLSCPGEIIAVNDGSTDNTLSILKKITGITVINNPYNLGYGASLKKGLSAAQGTWVAITDADGTYPIEDLPKLLTHIPEYDMVVGARTGKNVYIPFFRRPAKWIIGKLANFMTGKKIEDINSGMRVFNKTKAMEFFKLYPSGFSFTTTITLAFFTNDYTIRYVPINYFKRIGKSIMGEKPTPKAFKKFLEFITLIFRIIMYFRPLKFFLVPALVLIFAGLIDGIYEVTHAPTGLVDLPVLLLIIGIQTMLIGVLADSLSKK